MVTPLQRGAYTLPSVRSQPDPSRSADRRADDRFDSARADTSSGACSVQSLDAPRNHCQGSEQRDDEGRCSRSGADRAIQAAKRTADLIPMCHPLLVGSVYVNFTIGDDFVEVETQVETFDRTGVEMEAMTACAIGALTVYDMCKSIDRSMVIGELCLWEKTGGQSGAWRRRGPAVSGDGQAPGVTNR